MQEWEYTTIKVKTKGFAGGILALEEFEEKLNKFGQEGWELVSTLATSQSYGSSREVIAIFKRPKALL